MSVLLDVFGGYELSSGGVQGDRLGGRALGQAGHGVDGQALGQADGEHPKRLWRLGGNASRLSLSVQRQGHLGGNFGTALAVFSEAHGRTACGSVLAGHDRVEFQRADDDWVGSLELRGAAGDVRSPDLCGIG